MRSLNSDTNIRKKKQNPTQVEKKPSTKNYLDGIGDVPSSNKARDSKSPLTKKIKMTESGDNDNTFYLTRTEFDANMMFIEPSVDSTLDESTLDSMIVESTLVGSIANSSLDETLPESSFDITIGDLTLNSTHEKQYLDSTEVENNKEPLPERSNLVKKLIKNDNDATAYYSFSSVSSSTSESPGKPIVERVRPPVFKKMRNMFTKYRENRSLNKSDTSSFLFEESNLEKSYLCYRKKDKNAQDIEEIEILMSKLNVSNELRDEKELSAENVNKILQNDSDKFGPDIATTNLLFMVRQSLETYLEIEEIYEKKEEHARMIVDRRFHISLEDFFETVNKGIEKKEGLDRYEWFLEEVDKAGLKREKCEMMKKNLNTFDTFPILKFQEHDFIYKQEKDKYFSKTTLPAFYIHSAKVHMIVSKRRGYVSV